MQVDFMFTYHSQYVLDLFNSCTESEHQVFLIMVCRFSFSLFDLYHLKYVLRLFSEKKMEVKKP